MSPPLQLYQGTRLLTAAGDLVSHKITFQNYKHHYNARPFSIIVSRQSVACPVNLLSKYLSFCGTCPCPLFMTVDGLPVTRSWFSTQNSFAIQLCGLSPSPYKGHSFRISVALHAAVQGFSNTQIRILSRRNSNAFQNYLRVPCLSS